MSSGGISSLLEGRLEPTPHMRRELARIRHTALVEPEFWGVYDDVLADLGPSFGLDNLALRLPEAWPNYNEKALISGNIRSMMQFVPEVYGDQPGFIVDLVQFEDSEGNPVTAVSAAQDDQTLYARVRFFSALPFEGTVTGVVRRDHPGFDQDADEVAGQASLTVDIDPFAYTTEPRSELVVPFTADTAGVLGFYLELTAGDETRPWFTTCWDRLWGIADLELDYAVYRDNFDTYGHWPPSLPVAEPEVEPAVLFVKVRIAPAGWGVDSAQVSLASSGLEGTSGPNGIVVFSDLAAGVDEVSVQAEGYQEPEAATEVTLVGLQSQWVDIAIHAIPEVILPGDYWSDGSLVPVDWNREQFGDQASVMLAQAHDEVEGEALGAQVELETWQAGELTFEPALLDGSRLVVRLVARYQDESLGLVGWSEPLSIDGSAPEVVDVEADAEPLVGCIEDPSEVPMVPPHEVRVTVMEPHSPVVGVKWRIGDSEWVEVGEGLPLEPSEGSQVVGFDIDPAGYPVGEPLVVGVTNAAGLEVESSPVDLTVWDESDLCPPAEADEELDMGEGSEADEGPAPPRRDDDGCQTMAAGHGQSSLWAIPLAMFLAIRSGRRRSASHF
jgi:hypothetical protein